MPKRRKKRAVQNQKTKSGFRPMFFCALRAAAISLVIYLLLTLLLAAVYLKRQPSELFLQIAAFICCAAAFFFCGIFACRKNSFPVAQIGLLASLFLLLFILAILLIVSKGMLSLHVLIILGFALLLPIAGGLLGKRL